MYSPRESCLYGPLIQETHLSCELQVFNVLGDTANAADVSQTFPMIKMINWFDQKTIEADIGGNVIDWRATGGDASITSTFLGWLQTHSTETDRLYWRTLPEFKNLMLSQY